MEREAHLRPENAASTCARSVCAQRSAVKNVTNQIQVLQFLMFLCEEKDESEHWGLYGTGGEKVRAAERTE